MTSVLNGTTVDLGPGVDGLNLANGDNVVTTAGVENINGFEGNNTVTFIGDGAVGQSISLNGSGTNVLNLAGSSGVFGMSILGANLTVFGQTTAPGGNEDVSLTNVQNGTTYDLGAGTSATHSPAIRATMCRPAASATWSTTSMRRRTSSCSTTSSAPPASIGS